MRCVLCLALHQIGFGKCRQKQTVLRLKLLAAVTVFLIVNLVGGGYFVIARDYRVDWTTVAYLVLGTATFAAGTAHQSRRKPRN
jgi:hypothetical protein